MFDYETLKLVWWVLIGVLLIGLPSPMASTWAPWR